MPDWLEQKYIGLISSRLRNFKRKGPNLYNFSCVFCGDSKKNRVKARGYIYDKNNKGIYHCHNCGITHSIPNFIKLVDDNLYQEYQLEKIGNTKSKQQLEYENFVVKMKKPVFMKEGPLKGLKKVSQLEPDHPIKKFVDSRKIPTLYHAKLFSCPNFMNYTNGLVPEKFSQESLRHDETRLLIPFLDSNKNVHAYQGRSLRSDSKVKYITIVLDESVPKVYGLDSVDNKNIVAVLEGPIDSMFVPNSIATAGGDLVSAIKDFDKTNLVIVYDNEKYSKETLKKMQKAILNGYSVCIWPENIEHKDINDMILSGMSPEFIQHIIKTNTYRDLSAQLMLNRWKKVSF